MSTSVHRILLVQDDLGHTELVRRGFEAASDRFSLTVVTSIQKAREALQQWQFDLVICELVLPDGGGTELLPASADDAIPADAEYPPILLLTDQGNEQLAAHALQAGAFDYVVRSDSVLLGLAQIADRTLRQWQHVVVRETTERRLRESEARYRRIVETANEGIWIIDAEHRTTFANDRMGEILGFQPQEMVAKSFFDFMDEQGPCDARHLFSAGQSNSRDYECKFKHRDGSDLWMRASCSTFSDENGNFAGLLGMFTDVTAHKQAQSQWLLQKTLLECQSEASLDGIVVVSPAREWISVNQRFIEMWEIPAHVVQSTSSVDALQAIADKVVDPEQFLAKIEDVYSHSEKCVHDEVNLVDGRCFERYSAPVSQEGHYLGRVWYYRDITERKQAEQRTQDLLSQLARANRLSSMSEMASALAHEVNQPLGTIANYAGTCVELINKNRLNMEDLKKCLEIINEQCLRTGKIIGRLKSLVSQAVPRQLVIDVNKLVREVDEILISEIRLGQINMQLELDSALPNTTGDPIQIQQVLVNLIRNAVDASPNDIDARVIVSTVRTDSELLISVADQGTGIPEEQLEHVFEPYVSGKKDGLGLGLSISRTIITAHGGRLWASNNEGHGATFHISLPIDSDKG